MNQNITSQNNVINPHPPELTPQRLELAFLVLAGIFVFFNPFPHTTAIKEAAYYLSLLTGGWLSFKRKQFHLASPVLFPLLAFSFWAGLGLFFTLDFSNTLHDLRSHLLKYLLLYAILSQPWWSKRRLEVGAMVFILSATLFAIGGITYFYIFNDNIITNRLILPLPEIPCNIYGAITIPAILLSLLFIQESAGSVQIIIWTISLLPTIAMTLLVQSRGMAAALIAGLLVTSFAKRKPAIIMIILVLSIIMAVPTFSLRWKNIYGDARANIFYTALAVIEDYPIFGIGYGQEIFRDSLDLDHYRKKVPPEYQNFGFVPDPHNQYLSIAVRTGIAGLFLYLWIVVAAIVICVQTTRRGTTWRGWGFCLLGSLVALQIMGVTEPMNMHAAEIVFYSLLAVITALWRLSKAPPSGKGGIDALLP